VELVRDNPAGRADRDKKDPADRLVEQLVL
jgi:hypothetical protein